MNFAVSPLISSVISCRKHCLNYSWRWLYFDVNNDGRSLDFSGFFYFRRVLLKRQIVIEFKFSRTSKNRWTWMLLLRLKRQFDFKWLHFGNFQEIESLMVSHTLEKSLKCGYKKTSTKSFRDAKWFHRWSPIFNTQIVKV